MVKVQPGGMVPEAARFDTYTLTALVGLERSTSESDNQCDGGTSSHLYESLVHTVVRSIDNACMDMAMHA